MVHLVFWETQAVPGGVTEDGGRGRKVERRNCANPRFYRIFKDFRRTK